MSIATDRGESRGWDVPSNGKPSYNSAYQRFLGGEKGGLWWALRQAHGDDKRTTLTREGGGG